LYLHGNNGYHKGTLHVRVHCLYCFVRRTVAVNTFNIITVDNHHPDKNHVCLKQEQMFQPNISCRRRIAKFGPLNNKIQGQKPMSVLWATGFRVGNWLPYLKPKIFSSRQTKVNGRRICTIKTVTKTHQTLFEHNVLYV
jgi:hypothetical protein